MSSIELLRSKISTIAFIPLILVFTGCGKSVPDKSAQTQDILKPFEGRWTVVALDRSDKPSARETLKDILISVKDSKFAMSEIGGAVGGSGGVSAREVHTQEYALQVDPDKPAGTIDFAYAGGEHIGKVRLGIFAFEGDKLKICLAEVDAPRPTEFAAGDKIMLLVLERAP